MYTSEYKKEYYTLDKNSPDIGLVMMVKNETKRLHVSLKSVIGTVKALIMYDTGSTDDTIDIIKKFSEENKINLYLIEGTFVNFAESRNVVLEYAEKIDIMYLLLLDCNDELQGGEVLKKYAVDFKDKNENGFLLCQKWYSGFQVDKYYNHRFCKNWGKWRYKGSVHEWIKDTSVDTTQPRYPIVKVCDDVILYQDRTQDDDKTGKRFQRDYEMLLKEYKENPKDPRTVFYLSQTCSCLGKFDEALYYSKLRIELKDIPNSFDEELFHSYVRCAECCSSLNHDYHDVVIWLLKAYECSFRAESLVKLAKLYFEKKLYNISYMYAKQACEIPYPEHLILFVDAKAYSYERWHILALASSFIPSKHPEGKFAVQQALKTEFNKKINEDLLQFYIDAEKTNKQVPVIENDMMKVAMAGSTSHHNGLQTAKPITKEQFIENKIKELRTSYPKMKLKSLTSMANNLWKNREK
jgi:glycosyltransferase involved in cell wall biosynthesis